MAQSRADTSGDRIVGCSLVSTDDDKPHTTTLPNGSPVVIGRKDHMVNFDHRCSRKHVSTTIELEVIYTRGSVAR